MGFRYREIGPSRQINDGTNSITANYAQQKYFATLNCAFPVLGVARGLQLSAVSRILAFCLATRRCMNFSPSLLLGLDPLRAAASRRLGLWLAVAVQPGCTNSGLSTPFQTNQCRR